MTATELRAAITRVFQGTAWQRCRVHTMRNRLSVARREQQQLIAALIRTIFAQGAHDQLRAVADELEPIALKDADKLTTMQQDLVAYAEFPTTHWSKTWSNKRIERLDRELKHRTEVVGIFPNPTSVIRLIGVLRVKVNDEMLAPERRYITAATFTELTKGEPDLTSLPAAPRN